jgi:hypothetical protein
VDQGVLPKRHSSGRRLSDHCGVWCDLQVA